MQPRAVLLGNELFLDFSHRFIGECSLGFLDRAEDSGVGRQRPSQVDAVLLGKTVADPVEQQLVEIVPAQAGIAVAGQHFHHVAFDLDDGDVERASPQVVNEQALQLFRLGLVGERSGGRLVDDADDLQPRQLARFARGFALGFVEEGRNRDHRLGDGMPELPLGEILQRPEDEGGNLLGAVLLVAQPNGLRLAHPPLDGTHGPSRRQDPLVAGGGTDEQAALVVQTDHRGQDRLAVFIEDGDLAVPNDGHFAIGCTEIDSEDGFHTTLLLSFKALLLDRKARPFAPGWPGPPRTESLCLSSSIPAGPPRRRCPGVAAD